MNASELMIGDWVLHEGKPKRVDVIWGKEVSLYDPSKVWGSIYSDKYSEGIKPMPLTWELLRSNFPTDDIIAWWPRLFPSDEVKEEYFRIQNQRGLEDFGMNIRYVHELQHILKLFGIKKDFKIK